MPVPFSGGCACGAIRYECTAEPVYMGNCHCRECQWVSGGAHTSSLLVPADAVTITGEVKYHERTGDSGNTVRKGFCPTCGSPLFTRPAILVDKMTIRAGSLDDASWFRPKANIWTSSAQPWVVMDPDLPQHAKMPPLLGTEK